MERIWIRLMKHNKRVKDGVYPVEALAEEADYARLFETVSREMDIPAPLLLTKHIQQMENFNHTKFLRDEFLESVPFDAMELERLVEKKSGSGA